ncbi:MAG: glycosyltransferase family 87 protein [Anaerolineales bacterium]
MKFSRLKHFLFAVSVILTSLLGLSVATLVMARSDWHDFDVFYNAASATLAGKSIYIIVGQYNLPFWYLPWTAWFYIPYAIFPKHIGLLLYQATSVISAILIVNSLARYYQPNFKFQDKILILAFLVPMSLQLIMVGQMDYILLGLLVCIIWGAEHKKDILVGILYPFLLTKPHLIIPFSIFLFWRSGKRTLLVSILFSIAMLLIETLLSPGWHLEMLRSLQVSGQRVDGLPFATFPSLLGLQENWIGTANLPFTLLLIAFAILVLWKFRSLSTVPFLSLALAASLFCAPRAYAYDLPMLIPAMIWLTAQDFNLRWWLWVCVGIFSIFTLFSSNIYWITLLVFGLSIHKSYKAISSCSSPASAL